MVLEVANQLVLDFVQDQHLPIDSQPTRGYSH